MKYILRKISKLLLPALVIVAAWTSANASDNVNEALLAIGSAQLPEDAGGFLTISNQEFVSTDETSIINTDGQPVNIALGDYVAVYGELLEPGRSIAKSIVVLDENYVAGDSPEYLRLIIENIDHSIAEAKSGATNIMFAGALHDPSLASLDAGDTAEFFGAVHDGVLWALNGSAGESAESGASNLSAVNGLRGSGVRGLRGSGVRGLRGSGVRGLRGSGVRGLRGSGVRGLRGSGVRGLRGSGVRGLRGSGVRGLRGSGVRGLRGSGVR